ncbi:TIGR04104 family putative zinc finger protein [Ureibacillus sp. GCM10028918]|uniref:TIGR04104 family putative zinc finger protein n=1 Tax=Ureibacillus sp. GCM10028918 TaxID=3273429 RepID=UPI003611CA34
MQKCGKCNSAFSWSNIFKSFKWTFKPIECDYCGTKHKISFFGRCTFAVLTTLPMLIFFYFLSLFDNIFASIGVGVLLATVGFLLSPYVVRYKEKL